MFKRISLLVISLLMLGGASASAVNKDTSGSQTATSDESAQNDSVMEFSHMEAIRIGSLIYTMAECVNGLLTGPESDREVYVGMYVDAGKRMAYYSKFDIPMNKADLEIFVDAFYDYAQAGNAPMTKDAIRADLSRFKTIGEVAAYLSSAMLAGFE